MRSPVHPADCRPTGAELQDSEDISRAQIVRVRAVFGRNSQQDLLIERLYGLRRGTSDAISGHLHSADAQLAEGALSRLFLSVTEDNLHNFVMKVQKDYNLPHFAANERICGSVLDTSSGKYAQIRTV